MGKWSLKIFKTDEDTNDSSKSENTELREKKSMITSPTAYLSSPVNMPTQIGVLDPNNEFYKVLTQSMEDANLPGPDYLEFKRAIDNMSNIPMSEQNKYQAAYSGLQATGADFDKIVSSIEHYQSVLVNVKDEFENDLKTSINTNVTSLRAQVETLTQENAKSSEQIKNLTETINKNNLTVMQLNNDINNQLEH